MPTRADPRSDQELIDAAGRGDEDAFTALYQRYTGWVAALALRFTRDEADALDVHQEVFLYLAKRAPTLRLTAKLTTFLYPAVRSHALRIREKRRRMAGSEAIGREPEAPEESGGASRADLAKALAALPSTHREPLLMRFVDGMGTGEIALALGLPVGTVKSRVHNALKALRDDPGARAYFGRGDEG